jgi:hypothetical protein
MSISRPVALVIALFTGSTLHAQGILFVQEESRDGKANTNQVWMDKTHIRAEYQSSGERTAFVFDAGAQVLRVINLDTKTYQEITKAQLEEMRQQMGGAMTQASAAQRQMEEQLKNMPPQQRAMIEQMMRGRGGMPGMPPAMQTVRPEYRQTGSDKVGQWACTKYEGLKGQEKVAEVCTVDPGEFGLTPADFNVAIQLSEFIRTLMPQAADHVAVYGTPQDQGFSGIPVRRNSYANGRATSVSEVKEFRRESFPSSIFEVPAGFTQKPMMGLR